MQEINVKIKTQMKGIEYDVLVLLPFDLTCKTRPLYWTILQVMTNETLSFILEVLNPLVVSGIIRGITIYTCSLFSLKCIYSMYNCYVSYNCVWPFGCFFWSVLVWLCVLHEKVFLDGIKWVKAFLKWVHIKKRIRDSAEEMKSCFREYLFKPTKQFLCMFVC